VRYQVRSHYEDMLFIEIVQRGNEKENTVSVRLWKASHSGGYNAR
jgi:bacillopeptidase F (M6 metalloprotease family)